MSAVQNAILEEVIVVGYLLRRLGQLGWTPGTALVASAVLRGSYHLYQGIGGFIGNMVMGVVFVLPLPALGPGGPAGGGALPARHRSVRRVRAARGEGGLAARRREPAAAFTGSFDQASSSPSMTVTARPVSSVRSPRSSVRTQAGAGGGLQPGEAGAAEPLGPEGGQRGVRAAR